MKISRLNTQIYLFPLFFLVCFSCYAIRDLPERITKHVFFLAAQSALTETKKLTLPTLFSDELVKKLTVTIYENGTICLRNFWKANQEQVLSNDSICREFIFLLIALYHNLACTKTTSSLLSLRGIPWLSLAALYMRLQAIPLNKLFDVLDECLKYYQAILDDYSTPQKPTTSLTEWLTEYWWLPLFMSAMAIAAFTRWLRAHQTRAITQEPLNIVVAGEIVNINKCAQQTITEIRKKYR